MPSRAQTRIPVAIKPLLGLALALLLLVAMELVLRLVMGAPDPPIMVRSTWSEEPSPFTRVRGKLSPEFQRGDRIAAFTELPAPGVFRILVLGGSSVRGGSKLPLRKEFPALLQQALTQRGLRTEVLNLGRPAFDSHQIKLLLPEALKLQPSAVIVYTGHNDLGNALMHSRYRGVAGALQARSLVALHQLQLYNLLRGLLGRSSLAVDFNRRTAKNLEPISTAQELMSAAHMAQNLQVVAERSPGSVFVTPISNYVTRQPLGAGCPGTSLPPRIEGPTMEAWGFRLAALNKELARVPDCAALLHDRGRVRLMLGDEGGLDDLYLAKELDPQPIRAKQAHVEAVRQAARKGGARLADLEAQAVAEHGAPPADWFIDAIHFSQEGHQAVAKSLVPVVVELLSAENGP